VRTVNFVVRRQKWGGQQDTPAPTQQVLELQNSTKISKFLPSFCTADQKPLRLTQLTNRKTDLERGLEVAAQEHEHIAHQTPNHRVLFALSVSAGRQIVCQGTLSRPCSVSTQTDNSSRFHNN